MPDPARPDDDADDIPLVAAATVLLLRNEGTDLEVLMVRRNSKLAFGGMWVFPGGRVDDHELDPGDELGSARRAAARETREEAGLELVEDDLVAWSHWQPPPSPAMHQKGPIRRFSTWFFAAPAPTGEIVIDDGEIKDHDWVSAATALDRHRAGEIEIVPPTWITLFQLAAHGSVDQAMAWARERTPRRFHTKPIAKDPITLAWEGDHAFDPSAAPSESRHRLVMHRSGWEYIDTVGW